MTAALEIDFARLERAVRRALWMHRLTLLERAVMEFILEQSHGHGRMEVSISRDSQIAEALGLDVAQVSRSLEILLNKESRNMLVCRKDRTGKVISAIYGIVLPYRLWRAPALVDESARSEIENSIAWINGEKQGDWLAQKSLTEALVEVEFPRVEFRRPGEYVAARQAAKPGEPAQDGKGKTLADYIAEMRDALQRPDKYAEQPNVETIDATKANPSYAVTGAGRRKVDDSSTFSSAAGHGEEKNRLELDESSSSPGFDRHSGGVTGEKVDDSSTFPKSTPRRVDDSSTFWGVGGGIGTNAGTIATVPMGFKNTSTVPMEPAMVPLGVAAKRPVRLRPLVAAELSLVRRLEEFCGVSFVNYRGFWIKQIYAGLVDQIEEALAEAQHVARTIGIKKSPGGLVRFHFEGLLGRGR